MSAAFRSSAATGTAESAKVSAMANWPSADFRGVPPTAETRATGSSVRTEYDILSLLGWQPTRSRGFPATQLFKTGLCIDRIGSTFEPARALPDFLSDRQPSAKVSVRAGHYGA